MRTKLAMIARTAILVPLMTNAGSALAANGLPAVHTEGRVEYLSGGIGKSESTAIERAESGWPLTLEFAERDHKHGDFVADVNVVVRDAKGRASLNAKTDGPFLLAKLPPGRDAVDATFAGETLHDNVIVKKGGPTKAVLVWPAHAGKTRS